MSHDLLSLASSMLHDDFLSLASLMSHDFSYWLV